MPDIEAVVDTIAAAAAIVHIQQLAIRYAVKVDQRDIEAVAQLYVDDIDCGHWGRGRDAVIKMYGENDSTMGISIHQVTNHLVDLVDADHATGVVYLNAEHQQHDGSWARLAGAYEDTYERRRGQWFIARRKLLFWYRDSDSLPPTVMRDNTYRVFAKWPTLPEAWPTWTKFWSEHEVPATPHASIGRR
jgi:ketosteroid isomerase-like protein